MPVCQFTSNVPLFFIAIITEYRRDRNILLLCNILLLGSKRNLRGIREKKVVITYKNVLCKSNTKWIGRVENVFKT